MAMLSLAVRSSLSPVQLPHVLGHDDALGGRPAMRPLVPLSVADEARQAQLRPRRLEHRGRRRRLVPVVAAVAGP